jgi:hypothetical protein
MMDHPESATCRLYLEITKMIRKGFWP